MGMMMTLGSRSVLFLIKFIFTNRENVVPVVKSYRFYNNRIRISVASVLEIKLEDEDKYVLIKDYYRPEQYGPIGGVCKFIGKDIQIKEDICWIQDQPRVDFKKSDIKDDIRGTIEGKKFSDFMNWFSSRRDRENDRCIYREINEELLEGHVGKNIRNKASELKIVFTKRIIEGPKKVNADNYSGQFRCIDIYKPDFSDETTNKYFYEIIRRAQNNNNNLTIVTAKEIEEGRTDSFLIAQHTKYLLNKKLSVHEPNGVVFRN
jgi:hypothetical protein